MLDELKARIKIAIRNIGNLKYADDTALTSESEEELKSLFMKMKQKSKKVGLKFNIQKTEVMASSLITLWQIDGETMERVEDFIFLGPQITADGNRSCEIQGDSCSLEKTYDKSRQHVKKKRNHSADKRPCSQRMVFSVVLDRSESWTVKNAECQRIDVF